MPVRVLVAKLVANLLGEGNRAAVLADVVAGEEMDGAVTARREDPLDLEKDVVHIDLRYMLQRSDRVDVVEAVVAERNRDSVIEQKFQPRVGAAVAHEARFCLVDHRWSDVEADRTVRVIPLRRRFQHVAQPAADFHDGAAGFRYRPRKELFQRVEIPIGTLPQLQRLHAVMDAQLGSFERLARAIPSLKRCVHNGPLEYVRTAIA